MQTKKTIIKVTAIVMALATIATFAACKKKDKALVSTTTQTTTKGPGLEDITREETTVITDENGNEKTYIIGKNDDGTTTIYEKVLDENGKVVKGDDGKEVTKVYVAPTQPETPVDATQATEGTTKAQAVEKTTKAPKPNTTQAPKPAPTPQPTPTPTPPPQTQAPTNPPAPPAPAELTQQMKDDMVAELVNYAKSLGFKTEVSRPQDNGGAITTMVTPKSYNKDIELIKEMIEYEYRQGCKTCLVKWHSETPNKILVDCH